jgi:hypothetical protein
MFHRRHLGREERVSAGRRLYHACRALPFVLALALPACRAAPRPVRIVLVTLDTLRHDAVFGTDQRPSAMPRTLARARAGVVFDRFFSATSTTQPTHATLFTGRHPWQHGVSRNGQTLSADQVTVAEVLREHGFATAAAIGSFPVASRFGFAQGFAAYDEALTEGQLAPGWEGLGNEEEPYYRLAARVTESALGQLERARGEKQFFWFHYFDPHAPYGDTAAGPRLRPHDLLRLAHQGVDVSADVARARALYDQDAASLDASLERLFARLDRDADTYETHVIVTADHGESFGEGRSSSCRRACGPACARTWRARSTSRARYSRWPASPEASRAGATCCGRRPAAGPSACGGGSRTRAPSCGSTAANIRWTRTSSTPSARTGASTRATRRPSRRARAAATAPPLPTACASCSDPSSGSSTARRARARPIPRWTGR